MTNRLNYFITRSSAFGISFYILFKNVGKDAYFPVIVGTLLGIFIIYLYSLIKNKTNNNIKDTLKNTFLGKLYLFIFILFYLYLILIILVMLPVFVNTFYLTHTPKIIINLPFIILAIYLSYKNKDVLFNLSNILFYISLVFIIMFCLFITKYLDFKEFLPLLSYSKLSLFKCTLIYASITAVPQIITLDDTNIKDIYKNYIYGSLSILAIFIVAIAGLGDTLLKVYSYAEFVLLKQIKLFNFIENVENISSFIWYFDLFICLSALLNKLKENLPNKNNNISYITLLLIILYVSTFFIGKNYVYILSITYTYPIILGIFFLIFMSMLIYLSIKKVD